MAASIAPAERRSGETVKSRQDVGRRLEFGKYDESYAAMMYTGVREIINIITHCCVFARPPLTLSHLQYVMAR